MHNHFRTLSLTDTGVQLYRTMRFALLAIVGFFFSTASVYGQSKPDTPSGSELGIGGSSGAAPLQSIVDRMVVFFDTMVIPLLYAAAFFFFIAGVYKYFFTENEKEREKGRDFIVWGLVGIVVLFSVWGIVHMLIATLKM